MVIKIAKATAQTKPLAPAKMLWSGETDEFPYGWRILQEVGPDGQTLYREVPLTPEDFLDPQIGDHFVENSLHSQLISTLFVVFQNYYLNDPNTGVFSNLKMQWSIPDLKEPAPDIAVVPNIRHKETVRSSFDVIEERTRPCLVIEVMSPHYPGDDTVKVEIYQQAGVAEYIIINPHSDDETLPFTLQGYRLVGGRYREMTPDAEGRLLSQTTGIYFGLDKSRRRVLLTSAATGERLLTPEEEKTARETAELLAAQALETRQAAEEKALEAEAQAAQEAAARQAAEAKVAQEAAARQAAEEKALEAEAQAIQEAAARHAAEVKAAQADNRTALAQARIAQETEARRAAEAQAAQADNRTALAQARIAQEAAARHAVEAQLAQLQAELRRLKGE
jgi:Uma2 family endonuclease